MKKKEFKKVYQSSGLYIFHPLHKHPDTPPHVGCIDTENRQKWHTDTSEPTVSRSVAADDLSTVAVGVW